MDSLDSLKEKVGSIRKNVRNYPSKEATVVSSIFGSIKKKKTYDVLMKLEKANRIKQHLPFYIKYQGLSVDELEGVISEKGQDNLELFELLLIIHLIHASSGEKSYDFDKYFTGDLSSEIKITAPDIPDKEWYINTCENVKTVSANLTLEEFAETLVVPSGPYKGRIYKHDRAPYNRQIHKWMSPEDPCRELVNMWGVQIGKSTAIENACIYYMKVVPSEILAVLATSDAAEKFSKKRIEPRAVRAGVKFIAEDFGDGKKRASGNKVLSKEFHGGNFDAVTAGSPSKLASETKRFIAKDELDRWPLKVGLEGSPDAIADKRGDAWGERAMIVNVGSPTLVGASLTHKKFLMGTQHHYHIKCPLCDNEYPLEMGMDGNDGLTYETKAGVLDPSLVYYLCPHCKDAWMETDKMYAMRNGLWVPHATAQKPNTISTQLSSLYSPFYPWVSICSDHKDAEDDPDLEQSFCNTRKGLPYELRGTRPEIEADNALRDPNQNSREVPEGVLYLVASCDVQRGSKNPERRKRNPPRLELEILGIGDMFVTKSIEYLVIEGETDVAGEGAWETLTEYVKDGYFDYERPRDGYKYSPMIWLFDARDGERTEVVYEHCRSWGGRAYPSMGMDYIQKGKTEEGVEDKISNRDFLRYRRKPVGEDLVVYQISTNLYKTKIYRDLQKTLSRAEETDEFAGRCYFPCDYPDKYFDMLTAEEQRPDGTFYCASGKRNETLDLRVYNLAGADIWIHMFIDSLKKQAKAAGEKNVNYIDFSFARDILAKKTKQLWTLENEDDFDDE
jgi:phage terminase large subunit GpA-like protein